MYIHVQRHRFKEWKNQVQINTAAMQAFKPTERHCIVPSLGEHEESMNDDDTITFHIESVVGR
jgi:hypothetical protein